MSTESLFVNAGALTFEKAILDRMLVYGKRSHVWTSRWDVKVSGIASWIRLRFLLAFHGSLWFLVCFDFPKVFSWFSHGSLWVLR